MPDFSDDDIRAALGALTDEPSPGARADVARRAGLRRRKRWAALGAGASMLAIGVGAVVVAVNDDPKRAIVTDEPSTTTSLPEAPSEGVQLHVWPPVVQPGAVATVVLVNDSDQAVTVNEGLPEVVLPGDFSHEWTVTVPEDARDSFRIESSGAEATIDLTLTDIGYVPSPDEFTIEFAGAAALRERRSLLPDEVVVIGGNRLAIRWTSACNQPAHDLTFVYSPERVIVALRVGYFVTTDCLGEPDNWATIVDLPAPLDGRKVFSSVLDAGPGADPAVLDATRIEAWPEGEPLPALAAMDREPLSMLGITATDGWISLRPYDGCGAWVARPILDGDTFYVQAFVPADNEECVNGPTPLLGFSVPTDTQYTVFGADP